jgi:hypothetical protein
MAGGRGAGYTKEQLLDPEFNLELGMSEIAKWYRQGTAQGLSGSALATYVGKQAQRPAAGMEQNYGRAYEQLTKGPMQVQGITQIQSSNSQIQANTSGLLSQTSMGLGRIGSGVAGSNILLSSIVMQLIRISVLLAKPTIIYTTPGATGAVPSSRTPDERANPTTMARMAGANVIPFA